MTVPGDMQILSARVAELEIQNRLMRRIALAGLIVAAAFLLMGQAKGKNVITANEFILKDSQGRVRGMWTMDTGGARLDFVDENNFARTRVYATVGGSGMMLSGANGMPQVTIQLATNGPEILMHNSGGKTIWRAPSPN